MIYRSRAPLRISFAGGGTDVYPYPEEKGGAVLSATISKYAYTTLVIRTDDSINVKSLDFDVNMNYRLGEEVQYSTKLNLVNAAIKVMKLRTGFDLFLHSDAPPGSGLGTSSALTVSLVGIFTHYLQLPSNNYDIAEAAYRIEREEAQIKGGKQDQYSATFGGFNFIEFLGEKVVVNALRIKRSTLNELEYRLVLCYTGKTRHSAGIIEDQTRRYLRKEEQTVRAFDRTKELAFEMKNALFLNQIDEFGKLLNDGWLAKKKFSPRVTEPHIDEMYEVARKNGALGGKLLGAGGGGYLLLLCEFDKQHIVAQELDKIGGKVTKFTFDLKGLQIWQLN